MTIAPHHYDVFDQYREVPVYIFVLRHVGDGISLQRPTRCTTQYIYRAGSQRHKPHNGFEQCGLTRTIDPDQRADRRIRNGKACVTQSSVTVSVSNRYVICCNSGGGGITDNTRIRQCLRYTLSFHATDHRSGRSPLFRQWFAKDRYRLVPAHPLHSKSPRKVRRHS